MVGAFVRFDTFKDLVPRQALKVARATFKDFSGWPPGPPTFKGRGRLWFLQRSYSVPTAFLQRSYSVPTAACAQV